MHPHLRRGSRLPILAILVALLTTGLGAAPASGAPSVVSGVRLNSYEARLVALVNKARTDRGIPALTVRTGPTFIARGWAERVAGTDSTAHNPDYLGTSSFRHADAACPDWTELGENVARGHQSPDVMFGGLWNSPAHRATMLDGRLRSIGVGAVERRMSSGVVNVYAVLDYCTFGTARPTALFQPAHGVRADRVAVTTSRHLVTYESAADAQRSYVARVATAMNSAGPSYSRNLADDYLRFVAANLNGSARGRVELQVRDALDLTKVREVAITLSQTNATRKPLSVQVIAVEPWSSSAGATLSVPFGATPRTLRFALPAAARTYRSQLRVVVTSSALAALGTGAAAQAEIHVHAISLVV